MVRVCVRDCVNACAYVRVDFEIISDKCRKGQFEVYIYINLSKDFFALNLKPKI